MSWCILTVVANTVLTIISKYYGRYGLICSMSRKGNCWDNAVAESFFHTLKTELIYSEQYATREIAKQSIFQYIEVYYNRMRRHSAIGSIAPVAFENRYKMLA